MNATTPSTDIADVSASIELGHPVRSFTLTMLGLAVLLLGLQWTGAVHPTIEAPRSSGTSFGRIEIRLVEVHNASALPIRVEGASWPTTGTRWSSVGVAPAGYWREPNFDLDLAHIPKFRPFTLEANTSRWLAISVVPDCVGELGAPTVEVRTALGLHRTVDLPWRVEALSGTC